MGEQQLDQVTSDELVYVPASEFRRLLDARLPPAAAAEAFAALARINTLYMIARAWSGHIGTSFSSLEIMSWLFLNEIRDLDKGPAACDIFFSSKGHDAPALYSVLIGLGLLPEEKIDHLRRLHGLPGHPHVETPYIQANTGSLGMGISKAKGMAIANRLAGTPRRIFVLTGDGELQEGQFWESLASAAHHRLGEIVVDHRSQQDSVGHLGRAGQRSWRPRGEAARVRLARQPVRWPRRRRDRADVARARCRDRSPEGRSSPTRSRARACRSWKARR